MNPYWLQYTVSQDAPATRSFLMSPPPLKSLSSSSAVESSYHLSRIFHGFPQHSADNHLDVLDERIMVIVIAVQSHLIGVNNMIIIPYREFLITYFIKVKVKVKVKVSTPL